MNEKEYIEGLRKELNNRVSLGADQIMSRIEKENDEPVRVIRHKKFHADIPAVAACAVLAFCITASAMYLDAGRKNDMQEFSSECRLYTTSSYTTSVSPVNNPSTSTSFSPQNTVVSPISDINSRKPAVTDTSDFSGIVSETEKNAGVTDSDKCSETENSEMVSVTETEYSGIEEVITQGTEVTEGDETGRVSEITGGDESDGEVLPEGIAVENTNGYVILEFGSLDDAILKTYGENAVVKKPEQTFGGYNQIAYVLTEDCRIHLITVGSTRIVTMKEGTYPPVQKIKEEMDSQYPYKRDYFAQLTFLDENKYTIIFPSDSPANDILLNDENVVSIEETNVIEEFYYSNFLGSVLFECINGITHDEFYEEYKDSLQLVYPQEINGYTYDGFYGMIDDSPVTYEGLKKLFESDVDFFVSQISPVYYPGTKEYNEAEEWKKSIEKYNKLLEETEQDVSLNETSIN